MKKARGGAVWPGRPAVSPGPATSGGGPKLPSLAV